MGVTLITITSSQQQSGGVVALVIDKYPSTVDVTFVIMKH